MEDRGISKNEERTDKWEFDEKETTLQYIQAKVHYLHIYSCQARNSSTINNHLFLGKDLIT